MSGASQPLTAEQFVSKWKLTDLPERAASHEHFLDLCRLLGQPTPAEADPTGEFYCFEKAVKVVGAASKGSKGEAGFVDVGKKDAFGWEYKRKDKYKDLDDAYRQLYQYRDALSNPPLSIVCDIRTTIIRPHLLLTGRNRPRAAFAADSSRASRAVHSRAVDTRRHIRKTARLLSLRSRLYPKHLQTTGRIVHGQE
jgi:hypothetical protein